MGSSSTSTASVSETLAYIDLYELVQDMHGSASPLFKAKKIGSRFGDVVVRPLPPGIVEDREAFGILKEGFQRIVSLRHPNIVSMYGLHVVGEVRYNRDELRQRLALGPGDVLVVSEFSSGKRLDDWRREHEDGLVPLNEAAEVLRHV